jgi:hypothetical protein
MPKGTVEVILVCTKNLGFHGVNPLKRENLMEGAGTVGGELALGKKHFSSLYALGGLQF